MNEWNKPIQKTFFNNSKYILTTSQKEVMPVDDVKEVVVVGRSNVGKSTFINFLTNNSKLAKISSNPGKTRALSFFDIQGKFRLVDVPGYGYAKVSKQQLVSFAKMIDEYFTTRENIDLVILLLDMRRTISKDDIGMFNYFLENNIKFNIIGTKLDKCKQSDVHKFNKNVQEQFQTTPINYSSITKRGLNDIKLIFDEYLN